MDSFKIQSTVPAAHVADTLCSALEGGSNYWYIITSKREPKEWHNFGDYNTEKIKYAHLYPFNDGGALMIRDMNEKESGETPHLKKPVALTFKRLQKALEIMANEYPERFAEIQKNHGDADTGDCLLQLALFEELIYG